MAFPPGPPLALCPWRCEGDPEPKRCSEVRRSRHARLSELEEAGQRPKPSRQVTAPSRPCLKRCRVFAVFDESALPQETVLRVGWRGIEAGSS